jgi:hypothetical protein
MLSQRDLICYRQLIVLEDERCPLHLANWVAYMTRIRDELGTASASVALKRWDELSLGSAGTCHQSLIPTHFNYAVAATPLPHQSGRESSPTVNEMTGGGRSM